ncbi:hypothetical protein JCM11641_004407 [Rhodosporidiobolus odoratus]
MSASSESISNKVGNATHGTVGDETLIHQATTLASHSLDYAKGLVGQGKDSGADTTRDAKEGKHGAEGSHTLGELINEGRDLTANVLHAARDVIGTKTEEAQQAAADAQRSADSQQAQGYVAKARDLAAGALGTIEGYVAAGQKKAEEAGGDLKKQADQAAVDLNKKVEESKSQAVDAKTSADGYAASVKANAGETTSQAGSALERQLNK